jgi:hypothetical protein
MGFLFSGIFWGCVLILLGISVIIKIAFNVHIPLFRIIFAFMLLYLGVRVLMGGGWSKNNFGTGNNTVLFTEIKADLAQESNEYNIIFGKGRVSLTDTSIVEKKKNVKMNTAFGAGELRINPAIPMIIHVKAAFAGARIPDGNLVSFGEYIYKTKSYVENAPAVRVEASVAFGSLEIIEK